MATLIQNLFSRATDQNGKTVPGALMTWFNAGTQTPAVLFSNLAGTVQITNPVVADSGGLFPAIYAANGNYDVAITDAGGSTIIPTILGVSVNSATGGTAQASMPVITKTANYTVQPSDRNAVFVVDPSAVVGQSVSITADAATLGGGFPFSVVNAGVTGTVSVAGPSGQQINGHLPSFMLSAQDQCISLTSGGAAGWQITATGGGTFLSAATFYAQATFNGNAKFNKPVTVSSSIGFLEQTLVITNNAAAWDMSLAANAYITSTLPFTLSAPTNAQDGAQGRLRVNNATAAILPITFAAGYAPPQNAGGLPAWLRPGATYFDWWVSGGVIYLSRTTPNGPLNYTVTNATTGGANSDFIIPSWAKRITVIYSQVTSTGNSLHMVQMGSNTPETTGYICVIGGPSTFSNNTGFIVSQRNSGTAQYIGMMTIFLTSPTTCTEKVEAYRTVDSIESSTGVGTKTFSAPPNMLRCTSQSGGDTFTGGSITVVCE